MSVRCIQEHKTVLLWKGTLVPVCSFPWFHTPGTNDLNEGGCVCNPGGGRYWKHKEKHQNEDMQTARTVTAIFAGRTNEGVSFRIRGLVQQNMWASNMFGTRQTSLNLLNTWLVLFTIFRYGRKRLLFINLAVQTIFTFIQIFAPSWVFFCIIFFIVGMGQSANYMAAFVLGTVVLLINYHVCCVANM